MDILTALNRRILASPYSVTDFAEETTKIGEVASSPSPSLNCSENIWFSLTLAGGNVIPSTFVKLLTLSLK